MVLEDDESSRYAIMAQNQTLVAFNSDWLTDYFNVATQSSFPVLHMVYRVTTLGFGCCVTFACDKVCSPVFVFQ